VPGSAIGSVRDYLGHSKLSTTDRYVGAQHRPEDFDRLNRSFRSEPGFAPAAAIEPNSSVVS